MDPWLLSHPDVRGNARLRALTVHLAQTIPVGVDRLANVGPGAGSSSSVRWRHVDAVHLARATQSELPLDAERSHSLRRAVRRQRAWIRGRKYIRAMSAYPTSAAYG